MPRLSEYLGANHRCHWKAENFPVNFSSQIMGIIFAISWRVGIAMPDLCVSIFILNPLSITWPFSCDAISKVSWCW